MRVRSSCSRRSRLTMYGLTVHWLRLQIAGLISSCVHLSSRQVVRTHSSLPPSSAIR